jgi:hypothetical protein
MMLEWVVQRPAGDSRFVVLGTIAAPDKRRALTVAQHEYGAGITVQSALSLAVEQRTMPERIRPIVGPPTITKWTRGKVSEGTREREVRLSFRGLILAKMQRTEGRVTLSHLAKSLRRHSYHVARSLAVLERDGEVTRIPPVRLPDGTFTPCTWEVK